MPPSGMETEVLVDPCAGLARISDTAIDQGTRHFVISFLCFMIGGAHR